MTSSVRLALASFVLGPLLGFAQTPAAPTAKPSNATGQCKDGTYSTASSKSGACRGHNGVKDWYAAAAAAPSTAKPAVGASTPAAPSAKPSIAASAPTTPTVAPVPARAAAPAQAAPVPSTNKGPKGNLASTQAAAGGGPGLVWVNTSSNVYHCYGTDFYGKTKAGSYMSEPDAKAKGARPDHGKVCSK